MAAACWVMAVPLTCIAVPTATAVARDALVPLRSTEPSFPNLIYIKVPKTASSTTGGVVRRIAEMHGLSGVHTGGNAENDEKREKYWIHHEPGVWASHAPRRGFIDERLPKLQKPAFIFTMVRDPVDRCLSEFYHVQVEANGKAPTSANKIEFLNGTDSCSNLQLKYISPRGFEVEHATNDTIDAMVAQSYDLIGIDALYDETLVVLADKLGISLGDILYVKAKVSGQMTDPASGKPLPRHVPLSEEPTEVREFASSDYFRRRNLGDYHLIDRLSKTITDQIAISGHLKEQLRQFKELKKVVEGRCTSEKDLSECYWNDNGCAYRCLDAIVSETVSYV